MAQHIHEHIQLQHGTPDVNDFAEYNRENLVAWDEMAGEWETNQVTVTQPTSASVNGQNITTSDNGQNVTASDSGQIATAITRSSSGIQDDDGNDMFTQCLLPRVEELAEWKAGETVLDLGAGNGILGRMFARKGAHVTGLDFSEKMMARGHERDVRENLDHRITYDRIDLMDFDQMANYMQGKEKFDIVTCSTTLKSLPSLQPIARALPLMLKPNGRIVIVDLHPAFSKPAGHRGMELYEDGNTGQQILSTYIKVPKYLNIKPSKSEAVRGQPKPLWVFHRPFWSLMQPFFDNKLVLDAMREPAFQGQPVLQQAQSYHNFQQTPMLLAFRLRHADRT
ncbi:S-adenosyl-L-methionine-dependent methyltransferase [Lecanosticta acicola]|uniref:S-adenosyl-L-methionine-dependent methyltransferase n=1 Tax=Lecanosticta acicola TaxID=111012 RepID=A0AAI9ED42_9PEZI|nr:S-adenosyl-L-methionine-dependent methyltransferase [Lecanosticta acicola]